MSIINYAEVNMSFIDNTKNMIIQHVRRYPRLEVRDLFKFLHQSALGCEHLVSSCDAAVAYIKRESEALSHYDSNVTEPLDGDYSRVHLSILRHGLSPETLGQLFFLSAKKEEQGIEALEKKLSVAETLVISGELPFSYDTFTAARDEWASKGYPAIHHSEQFRSNYHPAYRVISNEFLPYLVLFAAMDQKPARIKVKLAIDGESASEKNALASILSRVYGFADVNVDLTDDQSKTSADDRISFGINGANMEIYFFHI